MINFGLKLWSTNTYYVQEAERLFKERFYQYIELYAVPDTFDESSDLWAKLDIPYIIHAPHFKHKLNLSRRDCLKENLAKIDEVRQFADKLKSGTIISHPGMEGTVEEVVYQLNIISDSRIVVENKLHREIYDNFKFVGHSPEEIKYIMDNAKVGFCLDFNHAICSANSKQIDPMEYIKEFALLKPRIYHLSDGDYSGTHDSHIHFHQGSYPLEKISEFIPDNSYLTIETIKNSRENLNDFINDINAFLKIYYK